MPRAPRRCPAPGCETRITTGRYCAEHKPIGWQSGGPSRTTTPEHRAWRRAVLARDKGACQIRGPRCIGRATEADHVLSFKTHPHLALDVDNGQAACVPCHRAKTLREATEGRRRAGL